uniref:uncharacterized protein LOC120333738 n=1 Tax=Styela clava TaxID=7725 RepID=UPI00193A4741|nr:uncharacterized protein LOC120333738 [Styela clava]
MNGSQPLFCHQVQYNNSQPIDTSHGFASKSQQHITKCSFTKLYRTHELRKFDPYGVPQIKTTLNKKESICEGMQYSVPRQRVSKSFDHTANVAHVYNEICEHHNQDSNLFRNNILALTESTDEIFLPNCFDIFNIVNCNRRLGLNKSNNPHRESSRHCDSLTCIINPLFIIIANSRFSHGLSGMDEVPMDCDVELAMLRSHSNNWSQLQSKLKRGNSSGNPNDLEANGDLLAGRCCEVVSINSILFASNLSLFAANTFQQLARFSLTDQRPQLFDSATTTATTGILDTYSEIDYRGTYDNPPTKKFLSCGNVKRSPVRSQLYYLNDVTADVFEGVNARCAFTCDSKLSGEIKFFFKYFEASKSYLQDQVDCRSVGEKSIWKHDAVSLFESNTHPSSLRYGNVSPVEQNYESSDYFGLKFVNKRPRYIVPFIEGPLGLITSKNILVESETCEHCSMGACCCGGRKSVDGDKHAPEILYFRSESDFFSSSRGGITAPATDSVIRRRRLSSGNIPLGQSDIYKGGSDYFVSRRRGSSTTADFLTREHPRRLDDTFLRTTTEPALINICKEPILEKDSNVRDVKKELTQNKLTAISGRRSSLEPIILEDHLGESSHLWLGVQHGESESEISNDEDTSSRQEYDLIHTLTKDVSDKITEEERRERTRIEKYYIDGKERHETSLEMHPNATFLSETQITLLDQDKTLTRERPASACSNDDKTLVRRNVENSSDAFQNEEECESLYQDSSLNAKHQLHIRDSPLVACVSSVADPITKKRYLVTSAMKIGLLDYETAAQLLEGQIQAGGIVCITPSMVENAPCLRLVSVEEGLSRDLVDGKMFDRLKRFEDTVRTLFEGGDNNKYWYNLNSDVDRRMIQLQSNVGGVLDPIQNDLVPLVVGVQRNLIGEKLVQEVINQQIVSGGVVKCYPLVRLPLRDATNSGLIDAQLASSSRHLEILYHGVRDPRTNEPTTYAMCVRRGIITRNTVIEFLIRQALEHGGWVRNSFTQEWLPITRAMHEGVVDVDMWEAVERAITRNKRDPALIHPLWLRPVSYFDFLKSSEPENGDMSHCKVIQACNMYEGIYDPRHNQRISLCEALNRDLTDRETAKRLLKAQMESGGLVDIRKRERVPVSEALSRKVIDFPMAVSLVQQDRVLESPIQSEIVSEKSDEFEENETLEDMVEMGIVRPTDMLELLQADGYFKGIIDMRTGKNVAISAAAVKGLITKTTVLQVLGTDAQIKGVVDVTTGDTLSVGVATRHGIIDRQTGMRILERQVASGGLLKPPSVNGHVPNSSQFRTPVNEIDNVDDGEKLRIQDAIKMGIIDPVLGSKLLETENAMKFNFDDTELHTEYDDKHEDQTSVIEKIVKDQLCALGGVLDPRTKEILPLHIAVSRGLLSQELASKLKQRQVPATATYVNEYRSVPKYSSDLDSITEAEEVFSSSSSESDEASQPGAFDINLARMRARRAREMRENQYRHRRMSTIYEEDEDDAIDQTTGETVTLGALSRRAVVEMTSGSRILEGLDPAGRILIHHTPEDADPSKEIEKISIHIVDAFSRGLLSEPVAFRLLEAHLAQGGIPDPTTGERVSPEEAFRRGYITQEMAEKLIVALKNLLRERAQMYVFRINELICWCNTMESEIDEYNLVSETEKPAVQERLLRDAIPELRTISDTLNDVQGFVERDRGHLDPFSVNELIVLSAELQEKAEAIEGALRDDGKIVIITRRPLIARCDSSSSASSNTTATSDGFALDEGLANNLARLQQLEEEADGINEDLRKFSEEECDASQEISDEQTLESLQKQLEQIKVINAQVLASTPGVNTAIKEAENFADENKDKLAEDLADELNAAKSALKRKWEIVKEAASEMLRQLEKQAKLAQDEEQRKASISSMLSELEPMLDHVREWVSQSHTKLDTEKPAEIDEKLMAKQFEMVEEHNKFISSPQEKIANILERYKNLLESSDIKLVLAEDAVPARQNEVEDLEKERIALLDTTQKRMKSLSHAKAELAQFCQGYSPFQCWLDDANKRCRSGKQAPKDISALEAESRDISALQSEISAHNADLRFLRITSKKLVEAAKAYNDTLDRAEDKPTKCEDDVITDPTEREVEKLMTITESFYDDVVKQAHDREQLLADVLKKRATYEASLPTVYPWLDQTETQLNNIDERPLPVEPNALQIQAKEVEQILQDVTNHAATVQKLEEAARDVIALPQEALEDSERNDIKNHAGTTRKRYDDLRCKATEKSTELNSALSKSQGISERLESLLKWLDDVERQLGQNKADTVAQVSKLNNSFEEANKINDSIKQRLPEVAEVKEVCSGLLGGGDGLATDSLHKRTSQLNTRFGQVEHGTSLRLGDLTELREKLAPFESNSNELSDWIESILDKLQTEDDSVPNESQLPNAELKLKEIRDEVESKRPVIIQTLREGESIVGDCRISDATPARDVMSHLSSSWEELQEILAEMEEDVTARREQMTSFEKSMADFTSWMKSVDDAVGDMKDSIVLKTLEEQIEKTQELLDSWGGKDKRP